MPDEIPFADGNVGGAVRVGDTVRRPTGSWTPAVHELLAFLRDSGLDGVPRVLGRDDDDREILTFLPGRSVAVGTETVDDAVLADAVRWLRRYHDVVQTYRPTGEIEWRGGSRSLTDGEIICHHDPGAYNWIVDGDHFVGMVDWDMAGPGRPLDDLAFMAWTAVPLFRPTPAHDIAGRLAIMATRYATSITAAAILDHADVRMTSACEKIAAGQRRGDPGMLNLAKIGEPNATRERIAGLRDRKPEIEAAIVQSTGR